LASTASPRSAQHQVGLGVLAFGDSITNGGGELQWGVALQSWALWLARGLGLPYTGYAVDGATVHGVLEGQIPAFKRQNAHPGARFEVACLYAGVNDVRALDWDVDAFERAYGAALDVLVERAERVLTVAAPRSLGVPRVAAERVEALNSAIRRQAHAHGALVLELGDLRARNLLMADRVHPTAFGQVAIAEHALDVLAGAGLTVRVRPSQLILYETTWRGRLRADATYAYRSAKEYLRAEALRTRFSL
jgi:lysophospholipase L1-like esterase